MVPRFAFNRKTHGTSRKYPNQARKIRPILQDEYHITELGTFGSYARGEQTESSDVDILVEFDPMF
ncbi:MAG: nucleotidyltransferase domain-containing protein [Cyanobacteria bacterium J06581_3]